jgi:hypothetical protein
MPQDIVLGMTTVTFTKAVVNYPRRNYWLMAVFGSLQKYYEMRSAPSMPTSSLTVD